MSARAAPRAEAADRFAAACCAGIALALGLLLFLSTGHDDAYIAFWPAHTLLEYGAMLNYSGDRVEQSSSLLYTLLLAGSAGALRIPVPIAGYWIGIACGVLAVLRSPALSARLGWGRPVALPLALGTLPIFLYWWFGGLETSLVAWLGVEVAIVAADLVAGRRRVASVPVLAVTVGFAMVRPEATIALASTLVAWLALAAIDRRRAGRSDRDPAAAALRRWLGVALLCQALLFAFRLHEFGQLFPQPVTAKTGGRVLEQLELGLAYYLHSALLRPYAATFFAALVAVLAGLALRVWQRELPDAVLFLLLFVAAHAAMVLTAGGDWMRGARFFAQFAPITLVAAAGVLHALRSRGRLVRGVLAFVALCNALGMVALTLGESTGRTLWSFLARDPLLRGHTSADMHWSDRANRVRTRDLLFLEHLSPVIAQMLEQRGTLTILSPQAGMIYYHLARQHFGRIRFVDMHGLTSPEATRLADTIGARRGQIGVHTSPAQLIAALEHESGASARPDLVFDVSATDASLRAHGYAVVHRQTGSEPGTALPWKPFGIDSLAYSVHQYAAVDAQRWPEIAARRSTFDWNFAAER